jgi:hypothetical protein
MQRRRIAEFWVLAARQVFARHRPLGQALEHEVIEIAALSQFQGRLHAVVGSAGASADAYCFFRVHPAFLCFFNCRWSV